MYWDENERKDEESYRCAGCFIIVASLIALIASILTIVFVICKCCGAVDWSWWIVFSPLLAVGGFDIACTIITLITVVVALLRIKWKEWRENKK